MDATQSDDHVLNDRIARHLRELRAERGWSLDQLAQISGISRASLSRLEKAEVSPTAQVLGKLCAAHGLTLSRLMLLVEDEFVPLVKSTAQPVWTDPETGFRRRSVSPPARALTGEALDCRLRPDTCIDYDKPPREGLEHHLLLLEGRLAVKVDNRRFELTPGDCLRYRLSGPSRFETTPDHPARYLLFMV